MREIEFKSDLYNEIYDGIYTRSVIEFNCTGALDYYENYNIENYNIELSLSPKEEFIEDEMYIFSEKLMFPKLREIITLDFVRLIKHSPHYFKDKYDGTKVYYRIYKLYKHSHEMSLYPHIYLLNIDEFVEYANSKYSHLDYVPLCVNKNYRNF